MLSSDQSLRNDCNQIELTLRQFAVYERYQRNKYIETLDKLGYKASEIHAIIWHKLGEPMSYRHLQRLITGSRVAAR